MKPNYFIAILSCLIIATKIQAQVITDKPAFVKNLTQVFHHRNSGFDSLVLQGVKEVGSPASKLKLPKVDETYIYNKTYHAGFAFKNKAQAEAFIKEVQGLISEAAIVYDAKAYFVPNPDTPEYLQFHIGNSEGFYTQPDEIELFDRSYQKIERPFVVYLRFNGKEPTFSYYVTAGKRIVNAEISNLVKDVVLGKDSLMVQLKGKKIPGKIVSYESKRTLKGYKATVYQYNDYGGTQNILQLIKNWTGKKDEEVFMKADTLMQNLKAALPATYCYLMDTKEQKVIFYPQPFSNITANAKLEIGYGRNANGKNAYYVLLNLYRLIEPKDLETNTTSTTTTAKPPKLYPFKGENGKYGYKNDKNEIVVQPQYNEAASFNEERGQVMLNSRYGYVNINGKEVVPPKYDYADLFFFGGVSKVKLNGKWGIINKEGKELVQPKYDDIDNGGDETTMSAETSL